MNPQTELKRKVITIETPHIKEQTQKGKMNTKIIKRIMFGKKDYITIAKKN